MAQHDNITASQRMICSCTGALTTSFFVTPLDVVKIRLQAQRKQLVRNKCFLYCNGLMEHMCYCLNGNGQNGHIMGPPSQWYKRPGHFNGTLDAFIKIARNEGVTSLWSGLPPTLVMAVPATVIYFTVYDQIREFFNNRLSGHKTIWAPALSGGLARVFSATVISPLEMIRTKMQSKKLSYMEIGQAVKNLVKTRGLLSLYVGLGPTLLRDVPFSCFYWTCYENLKLRCNQEQPTFLFSFTAGAAAGTEAKTKKPAAGPKCFCHCSGTSPCKSTGHLGYLTTEPSQKNGERGAILQMLQASRAPYGAGDLIHDDTSVFQGKYGHW
ncbi:mitochondrial glutathione transporter SLC25A40-like isoform X2 [Dermacentor albipictus]|uniref:mitochondrial glutathione transporter SLC25A40-like isoform X2 n=1 Tax=Dermacentor albipictus TaxID=60249 RepID=UPI0038FCCF4F